MHAHAPGVTLPVLLALTVIQVRPRDALAVQRGDHGGDGRDRVHQDSSQGRPCP